MYVTSTVGGSYFRLSSNHTVSGQRVMCSVHSTAAASTGHMQRFSDLTIDDDTRPDTMTCLVSSSFLTHAYDSDVA